MRIIAGRFRGTALTPVGKGDSAAHLRPTSDRVRESLFSMLTHLSAIEGSRVLDLFAGTGALGLEALSRGASHVTFVENGRTAQRLLRSNIDRLRVEAETRIIRRDATRLTDATEERYDLVFLDPPYGQSMGQNALKTTANWLHPGALVVWEEATPMVSPVGFNLQDQRRYGSTWVTLLTRDTDDKGDI